MAKAILFIHNEKVPVRSQRYPHLNLSRSTTVFPISAGSYLERLGKGKVVNADFEDYELEHANESWLKNRVIFVPIGGELYRARFLDELETLEEWAKEGVCEGKLGEYTRRLNLLRKEATTIKSRLFNTGFAEKLFPEIARLAEPGNYNSSFDSRTKLKKVTSREQELFKKKVSEALIRPMGIEELSRELRMTATNLRKRLVLLLRSGLVKSTTQRLPVGRPKVVYFLAHDI